MLNKHLDGRGESNDLRLFLEVMLLNPEQLIKELAQAEAIQEAETVLCCSTLFRFVGNQA